LIYNRFRRADTPRHNDGRRTQQQLSIQHSTCLVPCSPTHLQHLTATTHKFDHSTSWVCSTLLPDAKHVHNRQQDALHFHCSLTRPDRRITAQQHSRHAACRTQRSTMQPVMKHNSSFR
jgi:hypothetical protein